MIGTFFKKEAHIAIANDNKNLKSLSWWFCAIGKVAIAYYIDGVPIETEKKKFEKVKKCKRKKFLPS